MKIIDQAIMAKRRVIIYTNFCCCWNPDFMKFSVLSSLVLGKVDC